LVFAFGLKPVDNFGLGGEVGCDDSGMTFTVLPTYDLTFKKLFANPEHPEIIQAG